MAQIYIDRSSGFFNRNKPCEIYVDGKIAGSVASGEERNFEVEQGEHTVVAKMVIGGRGLIDIWVGESPKVLVVVKDNEIKKVKVSGNRGLLWLLATIAAATVIAIVMRSYFSVDEQDYKLYMLIGYFVFFALSYFAFGKKNYLTLTLEK